MEVSALRRGEDGQPLGVRGGTFQITVGEEGVRVRRGDRERRPM